MPETTTDRQLVSSALFALGEEINSINRANGWNVCTPEDWGDDRDDEARLADWLIEEPHNIAHQEDCQGNRRPLSQSWRVFAQGPIEKFPKSSIQIGLGSTPAEAVADVKPKILALGDMYKLGTVLMLITSEVAEALEACRKRDRENFEEELADILIRVLDCSHGMGIDIADAVTKKLEKNRQRGYRHGGKAC